MKNTLVVSFISFFIAFQIFHNLNSQAQQSTQIIGPEAEWGPGMSIMQSIKEECDLFKAPDFGECFASSMQRSGATPEAVAFTRLIGNMGFMRDFRDMGGVDIAYVYFPFRANENQGCFLVNGDPHLINVDDLSILPKDELRRDQQYRKIAERFPKVSLWPGDRSGTDHIAMETLPGGGQRFIVSYRLLNFCHACELVGSVRFAFDFDRTGKFLGPKFLRVDEIKEGMIGEVFTVTIKSNRPTGYQWQLTRPLNETVIKLISTEYKAPETMLKGAEGQETWMFKAVDLGLTLIQMKYIKPWEKYTVPMKIFGLLVVIKQSAQKSEANPVGKFTPLAIKNCQELREAITKVLKVDTSIRERERFSDYIHQMTGYGCKIIAKGTGKDFKNFVQVANDLKAVLEARGWTEDIRYMADGPSGTATAFRKGNILLLLSVGWKPSQDTDCPPNKPISACSFIPERQLYNITLNGAQELDVK